jgi:predicted TIM-barrel fold metal-dependent hydrolase
MADWPPVIDADGHFMETQAAVAQYLKAPWDQRGTSLWPSDQPWDSDLFGSLGQPKMRGRSPQEQLEIWLELMDRENFERAVLFPTAAGNSVKVQQPEFAVAVAQAFNDFVANEFNRRSDRVHAVGMLPLQRPVEAAAEMRRAVTELGIVAFELVSSGLPYPLGDPFYDPVWTEADRLGPAMCVHGSRDHAYEVGAGKLRTFGEVHCYAFFASLMLQFTSIIFGAVPVRFPKVRIAFLEVGATWLPYYLDRMDEHWEKRGDVETPLLKSKPSDIVRDGNIWFSLEAGESLLPEAIGYLGDRHFLYASDVPHWDNEFPKSLRHLWDSKDLSLATKKRILAENARELFHFAGASAKA